MNGQLFPEQLLIGPHAVSHALRAKRREVRTVMFARGKGDHGRLAEIRKLAEQRGVICREVAPLRIRELAGDFPDQGIAAVADLLPRIPLERMLEKRVDGALLLVALDHLQDPRNLGSIIRSAVAVGTHALIFTRRRQAPITPAVMRSAVGMIEYLPLVEVVNLAQALRVIKDARIWVTGMVPWQGERLTDLDFTGPHVLVIGGEAKGLRPLVRRHCDHIARIPMEPPVDSLNTAVATALALFEVKRQRTIKIQP